MGMTNLPPIKFGTDGWRAVIADEYTFANVERVAQAYADYLSAEKQQQPLIEQLVDVGQISKREANSAPFKHVINQALASVDSLVIVGYDRRFLSEYFAQRAAEVLFGNNFSVALFREAVPTPLISWAVKELKAAGGVVITASHNPASFNGFKIKAPWAEVRRPKSLLRLRSSWMRIHQSAARSLRTRMNYLDQQSKVTRHRSLRISISIDCADRRRL